MMSDLFFFMDASVMFGRVGARASYRRRKVHLQTHSPRQALGSHRSYDQARNVTAEPTEQKHKRLRFPTRLICAASRHSVCWACVDDNQTLYL